MEEIVIVGYGVQNRRDVSGSITTVKGDAIKTIPAQNFDQVLQGKATGVNITIPSGVLNNAPVIRIRGFNSINGSSYPLTVVDGVPIFTGDFSGLSASTNCFLSVGYTDQSDMISKNSFNRENVRLNPDLDQYPLFYFLSSLVMPEP